VTICPRCGTRLKDGTATCFRCGAAVSGGDTGRGRSSGRGSKRGRSASGSIGSSAHGGGRTGGSGGGRGGSDRGRTGRRAGLSPLLLIALVAVAALGIGVAITYSVTAGDESESAQTGQAEVAGQAEGGGSAAEDQGYAEALAGDLDRAREAAVTQGIRAIEVAVQTFVMDSARYPEPSEVGPNGSVAALAGAWPTNPYTDAPMQSGTGPGEFTYELTADGFKLTGYGPDGPVVTVE